MVVVGRAGYSGGRPSPRARVTMLQTYPIMGSDGWMDKGETRQSRQSTLPKHEPIISQCPYDDDTKTALVFCLLRGLPHLRKILALRPLSTSAQIAATPLVRARSVTIRLSTVNFRKTHLISVWRPCTTFSTNIHTLVLPRGRTRYRTAVSPPSPRNNPPRYWPRVVRMHVHNTMMDRRQATQPHLCLQVLTYRTIPAVSVCISPVYAPPPRLPDQARRLHFSYILRATTHC